MVATCSPHRSAGGTLHLPSPTHPHHPDPAAAAIRSLRRSLSSSPSRGPTFHLITSKSPTPSPKSPLSPSPQSPSKPAGENSFFALTTITSPSPLAIPFPPSAKIHRSSARKPSPMRSSRARTSPTSTSRRPLGQSRDQGNAGSPGSLSSQSSSGESSRFSRSASPSDKPASERSSRRTSAILADEHLLTPGRAHLASLTAGSTSATSSPLKRSDGSMDVDRANFDSPNPKRRSLHGGTFGADFNIFEHGPSATTTTTMETGDDKVDTARHAEAAPTDGPNGHGGPSSSFLASMPKRSSSLRKSTLQQRHHEKPTFARSRPNPDLAMEFASPGPAAVKGRGHHRLSLENYLPPMQRESPFSSHGLLPNASVHPVAPNAASHLPPHQQHQHQPHPLSYTMTQSSSGSSLADGLGDDSPTHAPVHHPEMSRSVLDFSKSLPMGAVRPHAHAQARERSSQTTSSSEASYVTPHNYKLVKPLPAAFMSTGLISKRNRSADEPQFGRTAGGSHAQMPDTPCKRPTSTTMFPASPAPAHGSNALLGKAKEVRHEFGTPSTPFNPHSTRPAPGTFGKGVSVFGSSYGADGGLFRRGSFVSVDGDESNRSPSVRGGDSQSSSGEYDLPPTPTKQIFTGGHHGNSDNRRPQARSESQEGRGPQEGAGSGMFAEEPRCITALGIHSSSQEELHQPVGKCTLSTTIGPISSPGGRSSDVDDDDGNSLMSSSPSQGSSSRRHLSSSARKPTSPLFLVPSSPVPVPCPPACPRISQIAMSKKLLIVSPGLPSSRKFKIAKSSSRWPPASPLQKFEPLLPDRASPHTPKDNHRHNNNCSILPPDPSGLSISGQDAVADRRPVYHRATTSNSSITTTANASSSSAMRPPATPTAIRESFHHHQHGAHQQHQNHHRRSSITPINAFASTDVVDPSLSSRFDKVELIGTGEFSQVYRVTEPAVPSSSSGSGSSAGTTSTPSSFYGVQSAGSSMQTLTLDRVYAVKKSRHAYAGARDRQRKLHEVEVLRCLLGRSDHVIQLTDSWEEKNHLYIQTEFCEEGSLEMFLAQVGRKARLDDFRIWKVMLELSLGVKHIHDAGFIHLDLKPANVLITFEGVLKIGDFGMANSWPAPPGIEGEGDREYIGPEILMGNFDKPADIFALGLIMLEIAGNVELPDNGPSWQKLRTGDMSDVPSLTSISSSTVSRDSSGNPISRPESVETFYTSDSGDDDDDEAVERQQRRGGHGPSSHYRRDEEGGEEIASQSYSGVLSRQGELMVPPSFMTDPQNDEALDRVVRWMISPLPTDRPVVDQILGTVGVTWADQRRRAGATIFEGSWGPADDVLGGDTEMMDV